MRHEMSDVVMRHEMSDMRWVTCDEWHVINWHWPYTFCEFPFLNPLVNPLLNPFLIPWAQAEWRNDETWDKWHEIETEMSERHPETLFLSFWAEGCCGVGISYCGGVGQKSRITNFSSLDDHHMAHLYVKYHQTHSSLDLMSVMSCHSSPASFWSLYPMCSVDVTSLPTHTCLDLMSLIPCLFLISPCHVLSWRHISKVFSLQLRVVSSPLMALTCGPEEPNNITGHLRPFFWPSPPQRLYSPVLSPMAPQLSKPS